MVRYDYACPRCGPVELSLPMGGATERQPCPGCGGGARRVYSAPVLLSGSSPMAAARAAAERSAHEPAVVRGPPPRGPRRPARRAPSANPLHARLPRP